MASYPPHLAPGVYIMYVYIYRLRTRHTCLRRWYSGVRVAPIDVICLTWVSAISPVLQWLESYIGPVTAVIQIYKSNIYLYITQVHGVIQICMNSNDIHCRYTGLIHYARCEVPSLCQPIHLLFLPHFRLYEVVSLHRCVLPYKYRKILEMFLTLMKLCELIWRRSDINPKWIRDSSARCVL